MRLLILAILVIGILFLIGCAANENPKEDHVNTDGEVAGFWMGLWHGIISVISFIFSLFINGITVYEVCNNGAWYNFGFLLGVGAFAGGAIGAKKHVSE